MSEVFAWKMSYSGTYVPNIPGVSNVKPVSQQIDEYLIATPHALLHYKIVTNVKTGKVRVFTDIEAKAPHWFIDAHGAVRRHRQFVRMQKTATAQGTNLEPIRADSMFGLSEQEGFAERTKGDEKAFNAWMTACGQSAGTSFAQIATKAVEITSEMRRPEKQEKALAIAAVDEMWGMF